mgnify:CR=1 FL=1
MIAGSFFRSMRIRSLVSSTELELLSEWFSGPEVLWNGIFVD